jgi:hypothetical protein
VKASKGFEVNGYDGGEGLEVTEVVCDEQGPFACRELDDQGIEQAVAASGDRPIFSRRRDMTGLRG